jgi:hypothetical protein
MNDKEYNNMFRFSLTQGNVVLCEKMFDADNFNPFTRYSIDVRDILPKSITRLQKTLSRRNYDVVIQTGRINPTIEDSEQTYYDLYAYHRKMINAYRVDQRNEMRYEPNAIVQQIEEKTIRGVECKIGLYINDNPIVERLFYVDGFNPVARWSVDIVDTVTDIADTIFEKIKRSDIKNMWDDYDLINHRGLSITQIRELSVPKREEMLRRLRRN